MNFEKFKNLKVKHKEKVKGVVFNFFYLFIYLKYVFKKQKKMDNI